MGQAKIRFDKRVEPLDGDGRPPTFQRPAHEAQVNWTHHARPVLGKFQKRAVSQGNLLLAVGDSALGSEPESVEDADQVIDRFLGAVRGRRGLQTFAPGAAGGQRLVNRIALGGKAVAEDLGEELVVASATAVHLLDRPEHQRRASGAATAGLHALHLTVIDQAVEVEAHGVGVHSQVLGDRDNAQRMAEGTQYPQHRAATPRRLPAHSGDPTLSHLRILSICGLRMTRHEWRINTQSANLGSPARRTQRPVPAGQGFGEKRHVVGEMRVQLLRQVVLVVDRFDRTHGLAGATVHEFVGVDVQRAPTLVYAIDRTLLHTGPIRHIDAGFSDHIRHGSGVYTT